MMQESQPSEERGTKPIDLWYRFWINNLVKEHYVGPKLSKEAIIERFDKSGFTQFTEEHFKVYEGSGVNDVYLNHPLLNKLYEH